MKKSSERLGRHLALFKDALGDSSSLSALLHDSHRSNPDPSRSHPMAPVSVRVRSSRPRIAANPDSSRGEDDEEAGQPIPELLHRFEHCRWKSLPFRGGGANQNDSARLA